MHTLRALALALPLTFAPRPAPLPAADADLDGEWTLVWDDTLDAELDGLDKQCRLELSAVHGRVNGTFLGDVAGRPRQAIFTGEREGPLVLLQQHERGYVCSFQLLVREDRLEGTWSDSWGGSGTALFAREVADEAPER
jgi:hypothetical protein